MRRPLGYDVPRQLAPPLAPLRPDGRPQQDGPFVWSFMNRSLRIHVVDDDPSILELVRTALELVGHTVTTSSSGADALEAMAAAPPDLAILDMMMPGMDGAELCRRLRQREETRDIGIIILSAKIYDADRQAAMGAGANAYATKPIRIEKLLDVVAQVVTDEAKVSFWGVRGTLPAPSPENIRYGGNTSCVSLEFPRGQLFVLDAGTGIRVLGNHLLKGRKGRLQGTVMITHPHWDHINALPFFSPLYVPGNQFEICGPAQPGAGMRDLVAAQMDGRFFPITPREFGADVRYRDLQQGSHDIQGIAVEALMLMHPGVALGYRFNYRGRSLCYITDQEVYLPDSPHYTGEYVDRLVAFMGDADILITDTTYTDAEYPTRVGWGHTAVSQVAELAHRAAVKRLCIFHHDPQQTDDDIDRKLEDVQAWLARHQSSTMALAPRERDELYF